MRPPHGVRYRRERIDTPDGDFLDLDFAGVDGRREPADDAPRGGHVGFIEISPLAPRFWAEREAVRFLAEQAEPILHRRR